MPVRLCRSDVRAERLARSTESADSVMASGPMGELMLKRTIAAVVFVSVLPGCAAIQVAGTPVSPQEVIVAANAFDALEATATVYLRLPPCPQAHLCRNAAAVHSIVVAIRAGRKARNELEAEIAPGSGALVSTNAYNVLTTTLKTLNSVYLQYGIGIGG